ncbi:MAG: hypothetical protein ABJC79_00775 [Acidimicrobiia bacterium]
MRQAPVSETTTPNRRGRALASIALIVVASLLLPFAGATVWVRNLMLDSGRYVETVAPLSKDPAVREAVATRVANDVVDALDIERRSKAALPKRARFLAAPIATAATELARTAALNILESDQFDTVWRLANQGAHDQMVAALTGRKDPALTTDAGKVVLNLAPLATALARKLANLGVSVPDSVDISRLDFRFVLVDSADLKSIQSYARLLDRLAWILPILTLLLYGLAILIAPQRRTGLLRVGVGITIAMAASLVGYGYGRTVYLDGLPTAQDHAAAVAIFDTITRFVGRGFRALFAIGLLVWLTAWLAGPSRAATGTRRQWNRAMGHVGGEEPSGPVATWFGEHAKSLRTALVMVLLVSLFVWEQPTGLVVLSLAMVALIGLALIQILAAGAPSDRESVESG